MLLLDRRARTRTAACGLQRVLRVADHLADPLVGDAAGRFVELARRVAVVARAPRWRASRAAAAGRRPCCPSRPCAAASACASRLARRARLTGRGRCTSDCDLASARRRAPRPAAARPGRRARRGRPGSAASCCCASLQLVERAPAPARRRPFGPLAAACRIALAASCSCRAASLEVLPLLLARELLSRRAASSTSCASCRCASPPPPPPPALRRQPALTLGFLLLPPRELLQLLGQLVDLLVAALLLGALLHLVLVRQLVELELEEVGEVLRHLAAARRRRRRRRRAASATCISYCCSASCSSFSARCSGVSASLAFWPFSSPSAELHLGGRLRQRLGDRLERRIDDVEPAVHLLAQLFDLLAQLAPARA